MARLRFGRPISLRWNGLLLEGPANTVFEIPDEFYEEFNQDIGPVEPTLVWLDTDEASTLRGRVTALEGAGSATLSSDAALALGTASAGVGTEASRDDHVHPTTGLSLSGHNHDASYSSTAHNHSGVYELSGAVSTHESAGDPHPGYLTETAASSTYATSGHNHNGTYEPVNTAILKTIVDAKGDLIVGTAADTVNRLPGSGTNGHVLTYDSAETTGLKWAAAPGSSGGTSVGTATPLALGTASAGDDATASREDHVHPTTGLALDGHDHDADYAPIGDSNRADIVFETCKNSSGTTIAKGKVVYIDGSDGTNPTIALADADSEATSSKTLGFTETSSNNGDQVNVITHGRITNIDTSAASTEGVSVWLSSTAGGYVFGTPPAEPAHSVYLGVVTNKNASTGEIFVKVQNGYELDELHDVSAASPSTGDILQYNSTSGMWEKESLSTAGIAASGHNHDGSYSTTSHNHDGTYSTTAHDHTGTYEVAGAVSTHNSSVTHLALGTSSVTAAAGDHNHTGVYEVSGTTATHAGLTTSVHGISNTADLVYTSDSRLSDARTPTAHTHAQTDVTSLTTDLADKISKTIVDAKGDIIVATASDTVSRLAVGATNGHVLTVDSAEATGLKWAAASGGSSQSLTLNQQTGTTYTLQASDLNKLVEVSNTGAITVTVPANILAVGDQIHIMQTNTGQITVAAGANVSAVNSALGLKLRARWSSATLIKRVTSTNADQWVLVGDCEA